MMTAITNNIGFRPKVSNGKHVGWRIVCSGCRYAYEGNWPETASADYMLRAVKKKGWHVDHGKPPLCGTCSRKEKTDMGIGEIRVASISGTELSAPNNRAIERKVYSLLESHFDDSKRLYLEGWSDDRIAKEIECAIEFVKKIRVEAYGELAEEPAVTALKKRLDDLEHQHTNLGRLLKIARAEIDVLRAR